MDSNKIKARLDRLRDELAAKRNEKERALDQAAAAEIGEGTAPDSRKVGLLNSEIADREAVITRLEVKLDEAEKAEAEDFQERKLDEIAAAAKAACSAAAKAIEKAAEGIKAYVTALETLDAERSKYGSVANQLAGCYGAGDMSGRLEARFPLSRSAAEDVLGRLERRLEYLKDFDAKTVREAHAKSHREATETPEAREARIQASRDAALSEEQRREREAHPWRGDPVLEARRAAYLEKAQAIRERPIPHVSMVSPWHEHLSESENTANRIATQAEQDRKNAQNKAEYDAQNAADIAVLQAEFADVVGADERV